MIYDPLAVEYNRGYNAGREAQTHFINTEERRFTAAVAAMQGMWADYRVVAAAMPNNQIDQSTMNAIARLAVMQADALLEELEK